MRVYQERDANLLHLSQSRLAVLGYGNLGRPVALNLRDSGLSLLVGNQKDAFAEAARQDRFEVVDLAQAVKGANVLFVALPDEILPSLFLEQIAPHLKTGDLLLFASGYNIAFKLIEPPVFVDVGLIAPRTLASYLRAAYLSRRGYVTYVSLHQRATPTAQDRLLAVALAMGALRQGAFEVTFGQEVALDLFFQQAFLPALHYLLLSATQTLVEEGYPVELALTELYLSGELSDFFGQAAQQGFVHTLDSLSQTGRYGLLSRTERFQESKIGAQMGNILDNIRRGAFAREWADEFIDGYPRLSRLQERLRQSLLWKHEEEVLALLRGVETP
jgi:ketol-acid reductoisomerase